MLYFFFISFRQRQSTRQSKALSTDFPVNISLQNQLKTDHISKRLILQNIVDWLIIVLHCCNCMSVLVIMTFHQNYVLNIIIILLLLPQCHQSLPITNVTCQIILVNVSWFTGNQFDRFLLIGVRFFLISALSFKPDASKLQNFMHALLLFKYAWYHFSIMK